MSGSSGTQLDQLEDVAVRVLEVARAAPGNVLRGAESARAVALDQRAHLFEGLHADAQHRPAAVVAAPFERRRPPGAAPRLPPAGAQLQLDPGGGGRSFRQPDDVAPE